MKVGNNNLIPAGPLREKLQSLKKYDAIFLKDVFDKKKIFTKYLKKFKNKIKIFYTYYEPLNLNKFSKHKKYVIFSGIGNPKNFKNLLIKNKINIVKQFKYPDHFKYSKEDILKIKTQAKLLKANVITTEKDYFRIY